MSAGDRYCSCGTPMQMGNIGGFLYCPNPYCAHDSQLAREKERDLLHKENSELHEEIRRSRIRCDEAYSQLDKCEKRYAAIANTVCCDTSKFMHETAGVIPAVDIQKVGELFNENIRLRKLLKSHGPEGHNVTNLQYHKIREDWLRYQKENTRLRDALTHIAKWNERDNEDLELCRTLWRGCVAEARRALKEVSDA